MDIRLGAACVTSGILAWGLQHVAHRPGGNVPGVVGLKIEPRLIEKLRGRIHEGSVVVVGTNGKTTVTNLLADVMEQAGRSVLCNRTGANLDSGIASALLRCKGADWAVLECDELWSAKVVPALQPTYYLLLNLFRDQLDRCGEIDHIQDAIVSALEHSPATRLIYNADDPLCQMIAERASKLPARASSPASIAFGVTESMSLAQNRVADATMCQACRHMFVYDYRQYGQLGSYRCPNCGFARPALDVEAKDIQFRPRGVAFQLSGQLDGEEHSFEIDSSLSGSYMVYNLTAIATAALQTGCEPQAITQAIKRFDPKNGRLQEYHLHGRDVLLNLAKNPTGFNQNLRIVESDEGPKAVAFFINTQLADGLDVSWIWDIDFEELADRPQLRVFAGGARKNDLQVRLKYAGLKAELIDGMEDVFARIAQDDELVADARVYAIANYTALPPIKQQLDRMEAEEGPSQAESGAVSSRAGKKAAPMQEKSASAQERAVPTQEKTSVLASQEARPVRIAHMLPDLLNLYGDGGNVRVLEERLAWRGIPVEVERVCYGDTIDFKDVDLVVLGGSPDKEQRLASEELEKMRDELSAYVEEDGPLLAICGSYQMLGRTWLLDDEEVPGLGILQIETRRPGTSTDRLISDIVLDVPFASHPVVGFENHAGRTYLDEGVQPFGVVVSEAGIGNNEEVRPHADGVTYKNVIGTYLHGPLLAKNPEVADHLLRKALERRAKRDETVAQAETQAEPLLPLDDREELAANRFMTATQVR